MLSEAVQERQKLARLTARRGAELVWLDVDAQSGSPIAIGLSSDANRASWRIVLRLRQELAVNAASLRAGTFEPPAEVAAPVPIVPLPAPPPSAAVVNWRELGCASWPLRCVGRSEGERIRTQQLPGEGVALSATVAGEERRLELAGYLKAWPGLTFEVRELPATAARGWCPAAESKLGEGLELTRTITRLQTEFGGSHESDLGDDARSLRAQLMDETKERYRRQVAALDGLAKPFRGSAGAAVVVVKSREAGLEALAVLIQKGCGGWSERAPRR